MVQTASFFATVHQRITAVLSMDCALVGSVNMAGLVVAVRTVSYNYNFSGLNL